MFTYFKPWWQAGLIAVALALTTTGCSFTDGEPWGSLNITLTSQTSASDLVGASDVTLDASTIPLEVEVVRVTTTSGGGGGEFDPSDPPAGYTLCHSGHCHSESGDLVPYDEVRAEMQSGGGTSEVTLARRTTEIDISQPFSTTAGPMAIGSRGDVSEVHVQSPNVVVNGEIRRNGDRIPLVVRLGPISLGHLDLEEVTVGPDSPKTRSVSLCADWPDPLFAGVDLDGLETQEGQILITKIVNADAAASIIDAFENVNWKTSCNA